MNTTSRRQAARARKREAPEATVPPPPAARPSWFLPPVMLAVALLMAYGNHFENGFHFDDSHTIVNNPFITSLHNIPRFFTDPFLFSTMPDHATWRPVVSVSLAVDYWLAGGLNPFFFHLSTFLWFTVQMILMYFLFLRIMDWADPHPTNWWTALAAAACYALHPANAETVNYVIQRADLYGTVGLVASLLWFAARPAQRKWGWYLLPAVAAYLSKAPALIFPLILLTYIYLFEEDANRRGFVRALRAATPALLVTIVATVLTARMTPATFNAGAQSASLYRLTQPWVALHYFKSFFLPTELSADSDFAYVSGPIALAAVAGYLFVAGLIWAVTRTARTRETRPIAFGLAWFVLALLPTSLMPLAEVTNDHRMFFPFVGLSLAVFWGLRLILFHRTARLTMNSYWIRGAIVGAMVVTVAAAAGTWSRNEVWHSEESLWQDVAIKSPRNGRGLMNYGLIFMERGDYQTALSYFQQALPLTPNYWSLEVNLGVSNAGLNRPEEAERHFRRAIELVPGTADPYFFFARWLESVQRTDEALPVLNTALKLNPNSFDARHLLMQVDSELGDRQSVERLARETLQMVPGDAQAQRFLTNPPPPRPAPDESTPEGLLTLSDRYFHAGKYDQALDATQKALKLRPGSAEAYNNLAAIYNARQQWDLGIKAAQEALELQPDYPLAKNNLLWALSKKSGK